jgi:uncharacterized membrane protein
MPDYNEVARCPGLESLSVHQGVHCERIATDAGWGRTAIAYEDSLLLIALGLSGWQPCRSQWPTAVPGVGLSPILSCADLLPDTSTANKDSEWRQAGSCGSRYGCDMIASIWVAVSRLGILVAMDALRSATHRSRATSITVADMATEPLTQCIIRLEMLVVERLQPP